MPHESRKIRRALFLGSKNLGLIALRTAAGITPGIFTRVATLDDRNDSRSAFDLISTFCREDRIPLSILSRAAELSEIIEEVKPDIVLVVGWYSIVPEDLLRKVPSGWVGFHASLLPRYRGGAPLVWALINGEPLIGLSFFYLDAGMDTGDIIVQTQIPVAESDYIEDVLNKVESQAREDIRNYWPLLVNGSAPRVPQDGADATYVPLRKPADGKIAWNVPARSVYNFIRAQSRPYPGAYTILPDGSSVSIWRARVCPSSDLNALPGTVLPAPDGGLPRIQCGDGVAIELLECTAIDTAETDASKRFSPGMLL